MMVLIVHAPTASKPAYAWAQADPRSLELFTLRYGPGGGSGHARWGGRRGVPDRLRSRIGEDVRAAEVQVVRRRARLSPFWPTRSKTVTVSRAVAERTVRSPIHACVKDKRRARKR